MSIVRVQFIADYDHRWPSRAMSAFKSGWSGPVKAEVADAAIAKGKAILIPRPAIAPADATGSNGRPVGMVGGDTGPPVPRRARGTGRRLRRNGGADGSAGAGNQPVGDNQ